VYSFDLMQVMRLMRTNAGRRGTSLPVLEPLSLLCIGCPWWQNKVGSVSAQVKHNQESSNLTCSLLMYNGSQDYHLEAPQSTYLVQPIVTFGGHCLVLLLLGTLSPAGSELWFPAW